MADDKDMREKAAAEAPAKPADRPVMDLLSQAGALQELAARQRTEAFKLPNPRLDDAQKGHHFLTADGCKVGPNGREIGPNGVELDAQGRQVG